MEVNIKMDDVVSMTGHITEYGKTFIHVVYSDKNRPPELFRVALDFDAFGQLGRVERTSITDARFDAANKEMRFTDIRLFPRSKDSYVCCLESIIMGHLGLDIFQFDLDPCFILDRFEITRLNFFLVGDYMNVFRNMDLFETEMELANMTYFNFLRNIWRESRPAYVYLCEWMEQHHSLFLLNKI